MKTKQQIEDELLLRKKDYINITGFGDDGTACLARINTLCWILDIPQLNGSDVWKWYTKLGQRKFCRIK